MAPKKPKQTPAWVASTAATAKVKVKLKSGDLKGIKKLFVDMIGKQVVDEWISIKRAIVETPTLTAMPFRRLWARMLSMFTA
jgi:hypothetical protein